MDTGSIALLPKARAYPWVLAFALAVSVVLGACSGGPDSSAAVVSPDQSPAKELPRLAYDFDRVCLTQIGFPGAAPYDATPRIHPVALFSEYGDPASLRLSSVELPAGWAVTGSASKEALATVELVACSRRVEGRANGTCTFKGKDGAPDTTLEMTDTTHELTIYEAATGKQVGGPQTLAAAPTECPMIAFIKEGDTKYFNDPDADQYVNALKAAVSPGS